MYFKPFRDPLYKVSLLSFQREVLRFAEPLEVVDGQLSPNCKEALNHFTTNVPWQEFLLRTAPEQFVRQSTSTISTCQTHVCKAPSERLTALRFVPAVAIYALLFGSSFNSSFQLATNRPVR